MAQKSYITRNAQGEATGFIGPEAVDTYRVGILRMSIGLHRKCGMIPTRGMTITKMLAMASQYTGETYKRGEHAKAEADLQCVLNSKIEALESVVE